MTTHLKSENLLLETSNDEQKHSEPTHTISLNISDIINICQEYNKLGYHLQHQVEAILELGVEEAITRGIVKQQSLPHIQMFLEAINSNQYFGDATEEAYGVINLIQHYQNKHQEIVSTFN